MTGPLSLKKPLKDYEIRCQEAVKYLRIFSTLGIIATGLSLYALRRVKIMRAMGTLKNDEFKVIYKRVNSFNLNYSPYEK